MDEFNWNNSFDPKYPNKVTKCTEDSETIKRMKHYANNKGGIQFYCPKRNEYIFIPTSV